jgi:hypothetical protein
LPVFQLRDRPLQSSQAIFKRLEHDGQIEGHQFGDVIGVKVVEVNVNDGRLVDFALHGRVPVRVGPAVPRYRGDGAETSAA